MNIKKLMHAPLLAALLFSDGIADTVLADSFDAGLSNWTVQSGDWSILPDNTLKGAWSYSAAYTQQGVLRLNNSFQPIGDFSASIDFTRVSNSGYYFPGLDPAFAASATFGFIQADGRRLDFGLAGAASVSNTLSTPQSSIGAFTQTYNGPGPYTGFGAYYTVNWDPSAWNTFGLTRIGSTYSLSLNGTLLTTFNDTTFNGAGDMALKTYGVSHLDNFNLSSVPDTASTFALLGGALLGLAALRRRFVV